MRGIRRTGHRQAAQRAQVRSGSPAYGSRMRTVVACSVAALTGLIGAVTHQAAAGASAVACRVDYAVTSQWPGGFTAAVSVTNLGDPVSGWTLAWSFSAGQRVTQAWSATVTQNGAQVTAADTGYNATLATGGSAAFGFNGSWNDSANPVPSSFTLNGTACTGSATSTPSPSGSPSASRTPSPTPTPTPRGGDGSPPDPDITYVGRWDTASSTGYVPNWAGAYLATAFTGTTVKIKQRDAVNMYVSIDGGADVFYAGVKGTVNLTPAPLPAGTHTLRVSYRSGDTIFQGLVLDPGATTVAPPPSTKLIEFVGDSITAGYLDSKLALSAYGWVLGERLHVRHTQIARAGYCLVAQEGCAGQSTQYFKLGSTGTADWDFSRYRADAVVINLGTNDIGHHVTGSTFQSAYTTFLRAIRAKYPNAALFAMETFKQRYVAETKAAVAARNASGDANVYYIDTEGWLTTGVDYADGDGHPNDAGHIKIANRLAPIIAPKIGVPVP
ncbi:cellulose binding domain-containing protein [Microbispora sp. H10836]|uniref:cellulose binding domain-containing protein n=1 Tax=Microbispora sp. H10836 TaxID=2729106 RepID=UPI001B8BDBD1|nr:cellulose binding domain-containing protein [Microbispora sp. H10836]